MTWVSGSEEWQAYDALPPQLRQFFQQTVMNWSSIDQERRFAYWLSGGAALSQAVYYQIQEMLAAEHNEMNSHADRYQQRWGHDYPHRAAGATVQRYANYKKRRRI